MKQKDLSGILYNYLIHRCNTILVSISVLTLVFILLSFQLELDNTGLYFDNVDRDSFEEYQAFRSGFGDDEIILFAVKSEYSVTHPDVRQAIRDISDKLIQKEYISKAKGLHDFYSPKINRYLGARTFWEPSSLLRLRSSLPGLNGFVSGDLKTTAFAVEFSNTQVNGFLFAEQVDECISLIKNQYPGQTECHVMGYPVLRAAFERYNLKNTATYTLLGLIAGTCVAFYIFKSLKVSMIVTLSCLISSAWTVGLMVLFGIKLTVMSGISLCFILIVSTTTVMHIVSKYYEFIRIDDSVQDALKKTLYIVLRPCFMCALTTSIGFASLMISPVKMIQGAGFMISLGVLCAFFIALICTVFVLTKTSPPSPKVQAKIYRDTVSVFIQTKLNFGLKKPVTALFISTLLLVFFVIGAWLIQSSNNPAFPVSAKTPESQSLVFFQNQFNNGYQLSMILEPFDRNVMSSHLWDKIREIETWTKNLDVIQRQDSISPLITVLTQHSPFGYLTPELLIKLLMSRENSKDLIRPFISQDQTKIRIIFHLSTQNKQESKPVMNMLQEKSELILKGAASLSFGGQMVLYEKQKEKIMEIQIRSLILTLILITLLMMVQLRSVTLGLISLIPNVLPLITMMGLMGFLNIALDPLMIFAAIISFGLSVDDSIHFLTQIKREISFHGNSDIRAILERSFHITSRALLSTTAVLFFSSLSFLMSSFDHVYSIGVLIASASAAALFGDLVLLPALILTVKPLQVFLLKQKDQV